MHVFIFFQLGLKIPTNALKMGTWQIWEHNGEQSVAGKCWFCPYTVQQSQLVDRTDTSYYCRL